MEGVVGYRFNPTDQEILLHYLRHMMLGDKAKVWQAIREISLCDHDPWELPPLSKIPSTGKPWFFIYWLKKSANGRQTMRTTKSGHWKGTGVKRDIKLCGETEHVIGFKRTLVFYERLGQTAVRTRWVLHEYHQCYCPPTEREYVIGKLKKDAVGWKEIYQLCSSISEDGNEFGPESKLDLSDEEFIDNKVDPAYHSLARELFSHQEEILSERQVHAYHSRFTRQMSSAGIYYASDADSGSGDEKEFAEVPSPIQSSGNAKEAEDGCLPERSLVTDVEAEAAEAGSVSDASEAKFWSFGKFVEQGFGLGLAALLLLIFLSSL